MQDLQAASERARPAALGAGLPVKRVLLLVVLLVVAAASGLLADVYSDETHFARNGLRGDLMSVVLAALLLLLSLRSARRGSVRGVLLLLGGLGYVTYQYGYSFAVATDATTDGPLVAAGPWS